MLGCRLARALDRQGVDRPRIHSADGQAGELAGELLAAPLPGCAAISAGPQVSIVVQRIELERAIGGDMRGRMREHGAGAVGGVEPPGRPIERSALLIGNIEEQTAGTTAVK